MQIIRWTIGRVRKITHAGPLSSISRSHGEQNTEESLSMEALESMVTVRFLVRTTTTARETLVSDYERSGKTLGNIQNKVSVHL